MYPQEIIPEPGMGKLSNESLKDKLLIRILSQRLIDYIDDGVFQLEIVSLILGSQSSTEVFELSTILLGSYLPKYCTLDVVDKKYYEYWDFIEKIYASNISYNENSNLLPLYLNCNSIIGVSVSYKTFDQKNAEVVVKIEHKPTRCNYWHFEVFVCDNQNNKIPRTKHSNWAKVLAQKILEDVIYNSINVEFSLAACL